MTKKDWYFLKTQFINWSKGKNVRDWMTWGTYGKDGKSPLKFVILKDMSDEHIQAILDNQFHIPCFFSRHFRKELSKRKKNRSLSIKES